MLYSCVGRILRQRHLHATPYARTHAHTHSYSTCNRHRILLMVHRCERKRHSGLNMGLKRIHLLLMECRAGNGIVMSSLESGRLGWSLPPCAPALHNANSVQGRAVFSSWPGRRLGHLDRPLAAGFCIGQYILLVKDFLIIQVKHLKMRWFVTGFCSLASHWSTCPNLF